MSESAFWISECTVWQVHAENPSGPREDIPQIDERMKLCTTTQQAAEVRIPYDVRPSYRGDRRFALLPLHVLCAVNAGGLLAYKEVANRNLS